MPASSVSFWGWLSGQPFDLPPVTSTSTPAEERRVWLRHAAKLNVRCEQINAEADSPVLAAICDLSCGGVQMIAARRFEPGAMISVELPAVRGKNGMALLACVVRVKPHGESDWLMGCRFAGELNEQQLQALGAERSRPASPDPRGWERFACDAKGFYQRLNGPDQARRSARVLNISVGGMALLTEEPIALGEVLNMELHYCNGQPIVTILACVVHTQTVAEGNLLGCNFIRELSEKDVRAFV